MQLLDKENVGSTFCRGHLYLSWTCARYLGMREICSLEDGDIGHMRKAVTMETVPADRSWNNVAR